MRSGDQLGSRQRRRTCKRRTAPQERRQRRSPGCSSASASRPSPAQFGRIFRPDEAWLAKAAPEPILEPDLAIVDTHHHLWDMPGYRYLLPDLLADLGSGHKVVATVFNECHAMYRAARAGGDAPGGRGRVLRRRGRDERQRQYGPTRICAGIVGHADLTLGDRVAPVLEAEIAAGGGRFRGVRHGAAWDDDPVIGNSHVADGPGLYRRPEFRAGMARLAALGLSFDAWIFHHQIAEVTDLARAFPEANIVLCHMGGAAGLRPLCRPEEGRGLRGLEGGDDGTRQLSQRVGEARRPDDAAGRVRLHEDAGAAVVGRARRRTGGPTPATCIELFGADRCMVESNFPVDKMGIGYAGLWNALKRMVAGASADEKRAIFSGTAARVYRLDLAGR